MQPTNLPAATVPHNQQLPTKQGLRVRTNLQAGKTCTPEVSISEDGYGRIYLGCPGDSKWGIR